MRAFVFVTVFAFAVQLTQALECYNCNSALNEKCAEFDEEDFKEFIVDCKDDDQKPENQELEGIEDAKSCRKILQEVGEKIRTVRECAYTGDDVDGLKRTGNKGVRLWYYQCSDGDFCNSSVGVCAMAGLIGMGVLMVALTQ